MIDSDYIVESHWLKSLIPYFEKEDVGFVQAPQDYRDWKESGFKAFCHWEYAGFFQIGMVQRNESNAIIQHGTMTLIRKSALESVGTNGVNGVFVKIVSWVCVYIVKDMTLFM